MRTALAAAVIMLSLSPALAAESEPQTATLAANGTGTEMVVPDIAIVALGVLSEGRTARAALDANTADMTAVLKAIAGAGVNDKDVATSDFAISPLYEQNSDGSQKSPPKISGYQVSNQVRVTIRDIANSGAILDAVVTAGANRVNAITFDVADHDGPAKKALAAAIADARAKATVMADAAGVKLVRILSVTTGGGGMMPYAAPMAFAAKSVPVMAGEQSVNASAQLVFEIAPQ
jgi:uncharacterized protein YggE